MSWYKKLKGGIKPGKKKSDIPENLWVKCDKCTEILFRAELERNLSDDELKEFYRLIRLNGVVIDFEFVSLSYIQEVERKGLKKGDAEIGAFCEWRKIDILISDNRDFLKGLSGDKNFEVMSPEAFYHTFLKED